MINVHGHKFFTFPLGSILYTRKSIWDISGVVFQHLEFMSLIHLELTLHGISFSIFLGIFSHLFSYMSNAPKIAIYEEINDLCVWREVLEEEKRSNFNNYYFFPHTPFNFFLFFCPPFDVSLHFTKTKIIQRKIIWVLNYMNY